MAGNLPQAGGGKAALHHICPMFPGVAWSNEFDPTALTGRSNAFDPTGNDNNIVGPNSFGLAAPGPRRKYRNGAKPARLW